jgi:hypothetical protein
MVSKRELRDMEKLIGTPGLTEWDLDRLFRRIGREGIYDGPTKTPKYNTTIPLYFLYLGPWNGGRLKYRFNHNKGQ